MRKAYINADIVFSSHDAFIVEEGHFKAVGRKSTILRQSIDEIIDLKGRTVFPGFHDSHLHLVGLGWMQSIFDASKPKTIESFIEQAKKHEAVPLLGRGSHEEQTEEKRMLTRADLDRISTEKPILIYRVCGHMMSVNSKTLELAEAKNGPISHDAESYDWDQGIFKEDAMKYVLSIVDAPEKKTIRDYILSAQETLLSHGVTSVGSDDFHVTDAPYEDVLSVFESLSTSGELRLNVLEQVNLPKIEVFEDFLEKGYANKVYGNYRNGPLKLLADGSLGARSAYMKEPYADDPDTRGIAIFDEESLTRHFNKAYDYDMDFAVHGIGDGIIDAIMNAKEVASEGRVEKRRDSIIHAQLADHAQIERMRALNLGAQTQPVFIASDVPIIEERLGERAKETYLFNTMVKKGVKTTVSTDAPIESTNPFENIYVAVTRKSFKHPGYPPFIESEGMTLKDAVKAYTQTPAYFSYQENRLGRIQKGHQADFIVVSGFEENDVESLLKTKVQATYKQGECVYVNER